MRRIAGERNAPPAIVPGYGLPVGYAIRVDVSPLRNPFVGGLYGVCKDGGFGLNRCQQGIIGWPRLSVVVGVSWPGRHELECPCFWFGGVFHVENYHSS